MQWRILVSSKEHPYRNMAIDEAIFRGVTEGKSIPTIRFYDWEPAAFSCGYNQDINKELDLEKIKESEYLFVRRPTGGRLVLHESEITYAVIGLLEGIVAGNISDTYLQIGRALLNGLKQMGIEAELEKGTLNSEDQKKNINPCFSSSSRHELNYQRKKLIGSAQTRNRKAFLQHGSILRMHNQKRVADFLPGLTEDNRLRTLSLLERKTISLDKILGYSLPFKKGVDFLIKGFYSEWKGETFFITSELEETETERVEQLITTKYSQIAWNEKKRLQVKRI